MHVWEMFCFLQMYEANEKSFRSIRANEQTQCSARLHHDWSRPIEQQGEITLPHLLRTNVRLLLASFVFSNRQLACYVARVSARFSQVTNSKHWFHVSTQLNDGGGVVWCNKSENVELQWQQKSSKVGMNKRSKNSKFNQPQTVLLRVPAQATNESVVPWIGEGAAFTPLIQSSTEPQNSSLGPCSCHLTWVFSWLQSSSTWSTKTLCLWCVVFLLPYWEVGAPIPCRLIKKVEWLSKMT